MAAFGLFRNTFFEFSFERSGEVDDLLPGEDIPAVVAKGRGVAVRPAFGHVGQAQPFDDGPGLEAQLVEQHGREFVIVVFTAVGLHREVGGLGHADGIGQLDHSFFGETVCAFWL